MMELWEQVANKTTVKLPKFTNVGDLFQNNLRSIVLCYGLSRHSAIEYVQSMFSNSQVQRNNNVDQTYANRVEHSRIGDWRLSIGS